MRLPSSRWSSKSSVAAGQPIRQLRKDISHVIEDRLDCGCKCLHLPLQGGRRTFSCGPDVGHQ